MKRLVLAAPSYGAVDPELQKSLRVAMMYAASDGIQWLGDVSTIRVGWVGARNVMAKAAVEASTMNGEPCDGIFWVDDDVKLVTMDVMSRLVGYGEDFVTGIVFQKQAPNMPLIAVYEDEKRTGNAGFHWWSGFQERVLAPIDGCGFGCCYTSTNLLKKIQTLPDFPADGWFNPMPIPGEKTRAALERGEPPPMFSEDFSFCLRARAAGVQLLVDTAVLCQHYTGPGFATVDDFRKEQLAHPSETLPVGRM